MSEPEVKMEKYDQIQHAVSRERTYDEQIRKLQKERNKVKEEMIDFGINCSYTTNCVQVGKMCYKCKNNYARRSYFTDLLAKADITTLGIYSSSDLSCFSDANESET